MMDSILNFVSMFSENYTTTEATILTIVLFALLLIVEKVLLPEYGILVKATMLCVLVLNGIVWENFRKESGISYNKQLLTTDNFSNLTENTLLPLEKIQPQKEGYISEINLDTSKNVIYELEPIKQKWGTIVAKIGYVSKDDNKLTSHQEYILTHNKQFDAISKMTQNTQKTVTKLSQEKHTQEITNIPESQIQTDNKILEKLF